jgi:hypothetical protein
MNYTVQANTSQVAQEVKRHLLPLNWEYASDRHIDDVDIFYGCGMPMPLTMHKALGGDDAAHKAPPVTMKW